MVINQTEFNKKYPKERESIRIVSGGKFEGWLLIEGYPHLKKLFLKDFCSIEKIILRNLSQLQEFTVWNCGTTELVIENCPQVKKLSVRTNSLVNLEFIKNLENLESLELDGNTELVKILKPYRGDWKACQKDIRELIELVHQNPYELVKKIKENHSFIVDSSVDFEKKYQGLKRKLASLLQIKSQELIEITTSDLMEKVEKDRENLEKELFRLKKSEKEVEQVCQKIEQKEKELEGLKNAYLEKAKEKNEKCKKALEKLLRKMAQPNDSDFDEIIRESKEYLSKKIVDTSQELDEICSLQETIIKLKKGFNRYEKQINQIIINGGYNINHFESTFYDSSLGGTINTNQQESEKLVAQILIPPKK